ncbi:4-hydroxythreonine-4-phosphate dehydrogenase PdxA [Botrimarina sp.]|uniref:4-hydroxythreonine-4-phosphate dehydrogenase PdxA n=1 Tax=Botrimarina sp. TaxID=2795802 RepID=UPI0032EE51D6
MPDPPALPRLAVTMGDPSGVGPEVVAAVWGHPCVWSACRPIVFGDAALLARAATLRGLPTKCRPAGTPEEAFQIASPEVMPCVAGESLDGRAIQPGVVTAATGEAAYQAVVAAARLALDGGCEGLVTAPLSKSALHAAGRDYPGHTELLAELCGVDDFAMMLYLPREFAPKTRAGLGVIHTTLHTSMRGAIDALSEESIFQKCRLAHQAAIAYGVPAPRIGVAALNPHAGEGGLFGDEEQRLIAPAVEAARRAGVDASGPHPVDTLMGRAVEGEFDAVVAMYHDQGHIALKLLGMHGAVNVTLGLPIVRTSVAHGTAPDKAWRGVAQTSGMLSAIDYAGRLAAHRAG